MVKRIAYLNPTRKDSPSVIDVIHDIVAFQPLRYHTKFFGDARTAFCAFTRISAVELPVLSFRRLYSRVTGNVLMQTVPETVVDRPDDLQEKRRRI